MAFLQRTNENTTITRRREMKLSKLIGDRFKERPANCLIDSHALMVRGGYIKNVANVSENRKYYS